jgi:hypothetical protein
MHNESIAKIVFRNQQDTGDCDIVWAKPGFDIFTVQPIRLRCFVRPNLFAFCETEGLIAAAAIAASMPDCYTELMKIAVDRSRAGADAVGVFGWIRDD